jgi:hypothetical protein
VTPILAQDSKVTTIVKVEAAPKKLGFIDRKGKFSYPYGGDISADEHKSGLQTLVYILIGLWLPSCLMHAV